MQEKTSAGMPLQRIALAAISLLAGCNDYHGIPLAGTNEVRTHTVLTEDQVGQVYTLAADGVTLDLGGHALTAPDGHYAVNIRASNVTVTNGRMTGGADAGGVRIATCLNKARLAQHNADPMVSGFIRSACRQGNTVSNIDFTGLGTHVYAEAFTGRNLITGNTFSGSDESSIYLDFEGWGNTITDNRFERCGWSDDGRNRECIAIDGNAGNLISGNTFTEHQRKRAFPSYWLGKNWPVSAIGLYRNCGEPELGMEAQRRQGADNNSIEGNTFMGGSSGIIFAMRTPSGRNFDADHCPLQIPDRAENNIERGNTFVDVQRPVLDYGKTNQSEYRDGH